MSSNQYHPPRTEFTFRASDQDAPQFPRQEFNIRGAANQVENPPRREFNVRGTGYQSEKADFPRKVRPDDRRHRQVLERRREREERERNRRRFPPATAERPLLRSRRGSTPDQLHGMSEGAGGGGRFIMADDLSDSDEQEMEMDSASEAIKEPEPRDAVDDDIIDLTAEGGVDEDGGEEPPRKRTFIESDLDNGHARTEAPKWSNPDPYADLFVPEESQRKRKDVVKLIRKARIAASQPSNTGAAVAANDDYISLNFDEDIDIQENSIQEDDSGEEEEEYVPAEAASNAPSSHPRPFSHRDHFHDGDKWRPPGTGQPALLAGALGPPPTSGKRRPAFHELLDVSTDMVEDSALGSRKRTRDDSIKRVRPPPEKFESALLNAKDVLRSWAVKDGSTHIPWGGVDHSRTVNMGFWLHKEICDFYTFVKPQKYEEEVRQDLIQRIRAAFFEMDSECDIRSFGSFATGVYLPTADMDLVCVTRQFLSTGTPKLGQRARTLNAVAHFLRRKGIAERNMIEVIAKAKVPILKFTDALTGIKVDISFENTTGLVAIETCLTWKAQYPAMPILVLLIKQFLMMRGLHEVRDGGLGGFSVICMVTSLLQTMPQVQSRSMIPEQHLGDMLMEFLDLYGNRFNLATTGIRFYPPGYFEKRLTSNQTYRQNVDRLYIEDPNRPDNDIAGGSIAVGLVFHYFSRALDQMQRKMLALRQADFSQRQGQSILWTILGGDYSSFDVQRARLRRVYEERCGFFDLVERCHVDKPLAVPSAHLLAQQPLSSRPPVAAKAMKAALKAQIQASKRELKNALQQKSKHVKSCKQEDGDPAKESLPPNPSEMTVAELGSGVLDAALTKPQGQRSKTKLGKKARRKAKGEEENGKGKAKKEKAKKKEEGETPEEGEAGAGAEAGGHEEKARKRKSVRKQAKAGRELEACRLEAEEAEEQQLPTGIAGPPSVDVPPVEVTAATAEAKRYNLRSRPDRAQERKAMGTGAAVERATKKGRKRAAGEGISSLPAQPVAEQSASAGEWRSQIVQAATVGFPRAS